MLPGNAYLKSPCLLECLVQLVGAGCSINAGTTRFAQTPTHIAAFGGHPHCLVWLIQAGAHVNKQDYVGETPVHKAARAGSMDCLKALVSNGAQIDFRNANGLTAADLAHSQGFQECAQFLLNLQNSQLNGFYYSSSLNGVHQGNSSNHLNGGTINRKRSFNDLEAHAIKKLRTEGGSIHLQADYLAGGVEDESMHVENHSEITDGNGRFSTFANGRGSNGFIAPLGDMETSPAKCLQLSDGINNVTNGKKESPDEHRTFAENNIDAVNSQACGSLHVNGSPSSWVNPRPSLGDGATDVLQYGYYHGFGDSAECLPEYSSLLEHSESVNVEHGYKSTFISTLHQYQGF
ncbi:ankyrin repeat domain-containing protein 10 isoform X2 [Rhinoderma darwinii]|uniref:ankyrin repeat domain-containing protein 10 isoform X2 n=1 Tax=Rhinoderma darwinii TaxID=43563 RepID=UPI003F66A1C3